MNYTIHRADPSRVGNPLFPRNLGLLLWVIGLLGTTLIGCPEVDNPYRPPAKANYEDFVSDVQPVLTKRCSFLTCHGATERRLTLYAVGFLRAKPSLPGTPLNENALTEQELGWNFDSIRLLLDDAKDATEPRFLLKNLDPAAGGIVHAGGSVIFESRADPEFQALATWIAEIL